MEIMFRTRDRNITVIIYYVAFRIAHYNDNKKQTEKRQAKSWNDPVETQKGCKLSTVISPLAKYGSNLGDVGQCH